MKIKLVKNGIFPIRYDINGRVLADHPATAFDMPGTIQGEGKLAGTPVLFIRTTGCNLRCTWKTDDGRISICDTPYASHRPEETEEWEINDIISLLKNNLGPIEHIIISGGEPTMQPESLTRLAQSISQELKLHISLETNGVHFIPQLTEWINFFSVSPKLKSSEPDNQKNRSLPLPVEQAYIRDHRKFRRNTKAIQQYINACMYLRAYYDDRPDNTPARKPDKDFQLKFVISKEEEIEEIENDFLNHLNFVDKGDVLLMPVGENRELLEQTSLMTAKMAISKGWRFSPRLQIDLFNDRRNV